VLMKEETAEIEETIETVVVEEENAETNSRISNASLLKF
jgi:hypothetical protein